MVYDSKLFNIDPFYDDYDEDKKFLRILYRPGFGLQARELTQMQTILQTQVQRFGDHIFEDGSKVVGCEISDQDVKFMRIGNVAGTSSVTAAFDGNIIFDHTGTTAQTAKVVATLPGITNDNFAILFYQELSGSTGAHGSLGFTHGTSLQATASNDNTSTVTFEITGHAIGDADVEGTSLGTAKMVNVNQGIRYVDGFFVKSDQQDLPVNLRNSSGVRVFKNLTTKVGFNVNKTTVSSTEDSTLTDPANGFYNYAAPGADRYKIDLVLGNVSFDPSSTATTGNESNFIETYRLVNDNVTKKEKYPDYSFLLDTLARRTYDESGNYTIRPFSLDFTGTNVGAAATSLTASLGAGKGYVLGYEIETIAPTDLTINKALDTGDLADDTPLDTNMGNYAIVSFPQGTLGYTDGLSAGCFGEDFDIEQHPLVILATGNNLEGPASSTGGCGTARLRQIDTESSSANTFKAYLYDINMKKPDAGGPEAGFSNVQHIYRVGAGATAPMFSLTADRIGTLNDPDTNTLLFEVANVDKMNSISDLDIFFKRTRYFTDFNASNGEKTFSRSDFGLNASGTDVIFAGSSDFSDIPNSSATVVFDRSGKILPGRAKTQSSASEMVIDLDTAGPTSAYVVANFRMQSTNPIRDKVVTTKTLSNQRLEGLTFSGEEVFQFLDGDVDVFEIVSITGQTGGGNPSGVDVNMTSFFDLDTGQRDNMYDFSRIVLKNEHHDKGVTAVDITYKHFARSGNEGPFIVNSYTPGISSSAIPEFISPNTGKIIPLANVVDFRPDRDGTNLNFLTSPGNTSLGVTGSAADAKQFLPTRGIQDSKVEGSFYLSRVDKIVLSKDRNFRVVEGVPSVNPQDPADLPDAMTLYRVGVNADTRDVNDVLPTKIENRRYTMRDIGNIEKRVENLEFFTKLSLEEEDALNVSITGANNTEVFKNGVLVDSFEGHSVGDVSNQFYKASVDFENGELRPRFTTKSVGLTADSTYTAGITNSSAGGVSPSGLLTLDYTTEKYINQIFANSTIDPNPSRIYNFIGVMTIDPPSDNWYDDNVRPVVLTNSEDQNDGWIADSNSHGFGTRFGDWASTWFGRNLIQAAEKNLNLQEFLTRARRRRVSKLLENIRGLKKRRAKNRIRRSKPQTILNKVNDKIVEQDVVRFIRSKTLTITAKGLRPNVRVYPFFDNVDVSGACTPSGGTLGGNIMTDSNGQVTLTFAIASGKFKDGDKLFRLVDDSSNVAANATTAAEAVYKVSGNQQEQTSAILSTRQAPFQRETVKDERLFEDAKARDITRLGLNDLLAQQFTVSSYAYPSGLFVKSVDLYVNAKDATLPITVQIRPVTNGYPNPSRILPFASATVTSENVTTTSTMNPSAPTTFSFDSPVYLTPGDYCITVQTNGSDYALWVGEEGEIRTGTTSDIISRQPYVGPLFESQNASAREPNKTKFLAFRINKCKFSGKDQSAGNRLLTLKSTDVSSEYGTTEINVHEYLLDIGELKVPGTNITYQQRSKKTSGSSALAAENTGVNETLKFADRQKRVIRPGTAGDFELQATLSSDNDDVSPVIDPSKISIITIENDINAEQDHVSFENFATPNGITNTELPAMRYISRQVNLEPGFESTDFTLRLEQQRPNTTSNIFAFLKVQGDDDETNFESKPFISLNAATAQSQTVQGENDFIAVDYTLTAGAITGADSPYSKFAVKIVMYDDNTQANVPKIRNLTAIAHGDE